MILPKEKLHVVYLFMPLRPIKSRAAISNSLNSIVFVEFGLANSSRTGLKIDGVRSPVCRFTALGSYRYQITLTNEAHNKLALEKKKTSGDWKGPVTVI